MALLKVWRLTGGGRRWPNSRKYELVAEVEMDKHFDYVDKWRWFLNEAGYVLRTEKGKTIYLSRVIAELEGWLPADIIDHKNRNKLDYRVSNLRPVTYQQSLSNRGVFKNSKLGRKGVTKEGKTFRAVVWFNYKRVYDARFPTEAEATEARDREVLKYHGEYAVLNK